jgi:hypothetical protein
MRLIGVFIGAFTVAGVAQAVQAGDALRVELACPGVPARVEVDRRERASVPVACAGIADALGFLDWLPREAGAPLRLEVVDHLPDGLRPDAVGCYAIGSRRLMVLELNRFLQRGTWFGIPVSERLWRSVMAHEVAHALVGCHLQGRTLPGAAHAYVAM